MSKPIIAVDIDDVLADSTESLRLEVNKRLGVNLTPEHYLVPGSYPEYYENVWESHGLGGKITMDELDPQMKADQSHVQPHKGAKEALKALAENYQLIIITGRSDRWQKATERWLEQHFPNTFSKLVFGGGREGLLATDKGKLCKQHNVSWLIDDNPDHAQLALDNGIKVVLFGTYGWHHQVPKGVVQCKDWAAVKEYFDGQ